MGSSQLPRPAPPKPSRPPGHRAWAAQLAGYAWPGCGATAPGGLPAQLHSKGWAGISNRTLLATQHSQHASWHEAVWQQLEQVCLLGCIALPASSKQIRHDWAESRRLDQSCCTAQLHITPQHNKLLWRCQADSSRGDLCTTSNQTRLTEGACKHKKHAAQPPSFLCGQSCQFNWTALHISTPSISEACLPSNAHQTALGCCLSACQWTPAKEWSP